MMSDPDVVIIGPWDKHEEATAPSRFRRVLYWFAQPQLVVDEQVTPYLELSFFGGAVCLRDFGELSVQSEALRGLFARIWMTVLSDDDKDRIWPDAA
jgi:hypothetical protein